jgi:hypothetical protein
VSRKELGEDKSEQRVATPPGLSEEALVVLL